MNQKELVVTYGPRGNERQSIVKLNGVVDTEALTPKMARSAAYVAVGHSNGVTVRDNDFGYAYRLYRNSARRLSD